MNFVFEYGTILRDKITGFQGSLISRADQISGNSQYLLQPPLGPNGEFVEARWIDEVRCRLIKVEETDKVNTTYLGKRHL